MRKDCIIIPGIVFLLAGCVLALASTVTIGINDAEWGHIRKNGSVSTPEKLTWSDWRIYDGSVALSMPYPPGEESGPIAKFRIGRSRGVFFSFTAYEVQCIQSNKVVTLPAVGSGWGAAYNHAWMFLAFGIGVVLIVSRLLVRWLFRHSHSCI